jgi:hypothetical protein
MTGKPTLAEGQAKLQRWADERRARGTDTRAATHPTRPRGNGDRDTRDVERGIERIRALLGR